MWSILEAGDAGQGVGHLRRLGAASAHDDIEKLNDEVLAEAADAYGRLNLVAPPAGAVWRALSRPSVALVRSVGAQSRDATAATLEPTVRPAMPMRLLAGQNDVSIVPALRAVLRRWCDLVRHTTGEQREVARLTLAAAMLARGAVLDGDTDTVAWFVERWLGLTPTGYRVDGTSAALLEGGWVRRRVDEEFSAVRDAVTKLRTESLDQHRLHRPVWHTQLRGRPVALLYDPIGSSAELIDTIGATDQALLAIETADVMRHIGGMVLVIHLAGLPGAAIVAGGEVAAVAARRHPRRRRRN
ncbi:hypothetical protein [Paractinoplanes toevensis]|uniref:Uncharacterized protein n=1 Tax=Paractinoplanes toevensis TaxID=571911 RepID=A0A919W4D4_9ACTN|nr:hypothetical protein [Actinoplanes toevensis]GIM93844.1 hypothetical protein Ato02nite_056370 [Actinoplanes toevensis]